MVCCGGDYARDRDAGRRKQRPVVQTKKAKVSYNLGMGFKMGSDKNKQLLPDETKKHTEIFMILLVTPLIFSLFYIFSLAY